jgi:hypothetical protein
MAHDISDGGFTIDDFHTLRERVSVMRTDYQQLLMDRNYLLWVGEMYTFLSPPSSVNDISMVL